MVCLPIRLRLQSGDRSALLSAALQVSQLSAMLPGDAGSSASALVAAKTDEVVDALLSSTTTTDPKQVGTRTLTCFSLEGV